jgi:ABC-2 type transport system ATP-binding protein
MIEARGLIKRYGSTLAVNDLSFTIHPGLVTGFLGPNGAGKTTTMRLILGLDYPSAGMVAINGKPYAALASPMHEVGALLDARAVHGGRSAYSHLLCLAQTNDIPRRRVGEVLGIVGLTDVARKRSKGFSLGMSQRLGIAAALLGDPGILMFDEPVNGLDPEGILWIRTLMRSLAAEGRTVLVSSHLMSEMENTADHLIVVGRGRLIADCGMAEFIARSSGQVVLARTPQPGALARAVTAAGGSVRGLGRGGGVVAGAAAAGTSASVARSAELEVTGLTEARVGDIAYANGIPLHHLALSRASLEQAFMELTADSVDYHAQVPVGASAHDGTEA